MAGALPQRPLCVDRVPEFSRVRTWQDQADVDEEPLRVLISGAQGVGKTTLGVVLAYTLKGHYPDGVVFVECGGQDDGDVLEELAARVLHQLDVPEVPGAAAVRIDLVRRTMAGRRLLLVFDDVANADQVLPLLGDVRRSAVLVTARGKLASLANNGFRTIELGGLPEDAAAELVTTLANPPLTEIDRSVLDKLHFLCDGLPLALSAAAARLRDGDESPEEFVAALGLGGALHELEVDGKPLLKVVFDAVYQSLSAADSRAYVTLGLVEGREFTVDVAAAVLRLSTRDAARQLRRLTEKYLLTSPAAGRFRFHRLVLEHARDTATAVLTADERTAAIRRADQARLHRAIGLDRAYHGRSAPKGAEDLYDSVGAAFTGDDAAGKAADAFDVDWPNFVASVHSMARDGSRPDLLATFVMALWGFAYRAGRSTSLIDCYRRALDYTHEPAVRWQLCRDLAALYEGEGEHDLCAEFVRLGFAAGYPAGNASLHEWHGLALEGRDDLAGAVAKLEMAWHAVSQMDDSAHHDRARALITMHLGRIAWKRDELAAADTKTREARDYFATRPSADAGNLAMCDDRLGSIAHTRGDLTSARSLLEQAVETFVRVKEIPRVIRALAELVEIATKQGDAGAAAAYRERRDALAQPGTGPA